VAGRGVPGAVGGENIPSEERLIMAQFNVNFGVDTGGGATATVVAGPTSPKMAA
jgi:hypothetical protein